MSLTRCSWLGKYTSDLPKEVTPVKKEEHEDKKEATKNEGIIRYIWYLPKMILQGSIGKIIMQKALITNIPGNPTRYNSRSSKLNFRKTRPRPNPEIVLRIIKTVIQFFFRIFDSWKNIKKIQLRPAEYTV